MAQKRNSHKKDFSWPLQFKWGYQIHQDCHRRKRFHRLARRGGRATVIEPNFAFIPAAHLDVACKASKVSYRLQPSSSTAHSIPKSLPSTNRCLCANRAGSCGSFYLAGWGGSLWGRGCALAADDKWHLERNVIRAGQTKTTPLRFWQCSVLALASHATTQIPNHPS